MKKIYQICLLLFIGLLLGTQVNAQDARVVHIPSSDDPTMLADIFPVIMGDTMPDGSRVDNNTIYELDNGGVYITSGRIVNKAEWPLHIRAVDNDDIVNKPVITRIPNASGSYPDIMRPEGDVTLRNLHIISGEKGPGENHDWGKIRFFGHGSTVRVDDCKIEKDRGGFLQMRADSIKCYVNNCHFLNGGNRFLREGNGRGIDSRNFAMDTLIVRNTVIHNIIDRVFRSLGNVIPHNYIEFDNNTIFNVGGRHGTFVFEKVLTAKVTNNLMINPMALGDAVFNTDEQNNADNVEGDPLFNPGMRIFTVDTLYDNTEFIISNNNIFWTQDIIDIWAQYDTVSKPPIYDALVSQSMGADTAGSYFEEVITLRSVPDNITQYVADHWADPSSEMMADHTVEDISRAGTVFDFGNLFDFATFDPCYDLDGTASSTGATDGGPVGVRTWCGITVSVFDEEINSNINLSIAPNPMNTRANFEFDLERQGTVDLSIHDVTGKLVHTLIRGELGSGHHQIEWTKVSALTPGFYLARLLTEEGQMAVKISVH